MMQQAKRKLVLEQVRLAFVCVYHSVSQPVDVKCAKVPRCMCHDNDPVDAVHQALGSGLGDLVQISRMRTSHIQADSELQRWSGISWPLRGPCTLTTPISR